MKVLLVTGRLAEAQVRAFAGEADVLVANVDVAAFITPQMLLAERPGATTSSDSRRHNRRFSGKPNVLLVPKSAWGPSTRQTWRSATSSRQGEDKLSAPFLLACCMEGKMREDALDQVERLEARASAPLQIRGVKIGGNSRMKVLARSSMPLAFALRIWRKKFATMRCRAQT